MNLKKFVEGLHFPKIIAGGDRIGKTDLGVLKVAFMVAALDGEVTESEYEVFDGLAKQCRGCTPVNAEQALAESMRSAGYLLLLARRVPCEKLVEAFVREAKAALPEGFADFELADVRRAFALWIAMGMGDGDYSDREKACIEALRQNFATMKVEHADEESARAAALSSAFRMAYARDAGTPVVEVITRPFAERVEAVMASLGSAADGEKALAELLG